MYSNQRSLDCQLADQQGELEFEHRAFFFPERVLRRAIPAHRADHFGQLSECDERDDWL